MLAVTTIRNIMSPCRNSYQRIETDHTRNAPFAPLLKITSLQTQREVGAYTAPQSSFAFCTAVYTGQIQPDRMKTKQACGQKHRGDVQAAGAQLTAEFEFLNRLPASSRTPHLCPEEGPASKIVARVFVGSYFVSQRK
ncbi:unnamed protein product [Ectocarpus sp. 12 AP-2014]